MNTIDYIKREIKQLYQAESNIHICVKMPHSKIITKDVPAKIVGVYKNIFQVEESSGGRTERHTFQYGDVLIGQVVIEELDYAPLESLLNKK